MDTDALDELPLGVLLALAEAAADPTAQGRRRAAARAAEAGVHLLCTASPPEHTEPIEMEPAPEGVEALTLHFGDR